MKINISHLAIFPIILVLTSTCLGDNCYERKGLAGVIEESLHYTDSWNRCWNLHVPKDSYARLDFSQYSGSDRRCSEISVRVTSDDRAVPHYFCFAKGSTSDSTTAKSNVKIFFRTDRNDKAASIGSRFKIVYHIEDLVCTEKNHFRCSNHSCIQQHKVCDGIKDCENGNDELNCVTTVQGVSASKGKAISWLKSQRSPFYRWDKNTHRAITAFYLAGESSFHGKDLEEELVAKQLELEIALALLRNSTDPLSVGELSMFIDALTVTCHEPRQFYGEDLLRTLAERVSTLQSPSPRAYLTLCNSNWTLTKSDVGNLLTLLKKQSKYPFLLDVQAVTVMALACARSRFKEFETIPNAWQTYNASIAKIIAGQQPDGSFGNVYTTALVTQALMSSNKLEAVHGWDFKSTMEYLMKQLNSSHDILSAYLAIPIFSGESLTDLQLVNCSNSFRKQNKDGVSDVTSQIGVRKRIQFSLYVGDRKDVIHTIYVRMPENSTAYDVMRVAAELDSKYKFHYKYISGDMYVYEIAGTTNDPEGGQFWLLYTGDNNIDGEVEHHLESPDRFFLGDSEHLILWYKTALI